MKRLRRSEWFIAAPAGLLATVLLWGPGCGSVPIEDGSANAVANANISPNANGNANINPPQMGITAHEAQDAIAERLTTVNRDLPLWNIQPGLGTVMIEYGRRFAMCYQAAQAGDWGMASYQLKEAKEIQEVGETTRPARADLLKAFEQSFLDPLEADIQNKDLPAFNGHASSAITGCNNCHVATDHGYVVVQLPTAVPQDFLALGPSDPLPPEQPQTFTSPTPPFAPDQGLTADQVLQLIDFSLDNVDRNLDLWNLQPGLGTVMMEYGRRFAMIKQCADGGNWGMAQYQLKEAREIQEVGETTRPRRAPLLTTFESSFLDPLDAAINARDYTAFNNAYASTIVGCNNCHQGTGFGFVRVQTFRSPPEPILTELATAPVAPSPSTPPMPQTPTLPVNPPTIEDVNNLLDQRFSTVDRTLALWDIQPGLGTVMMEYGYRFGSAWFDAEGNNWDMADYQIREAIEIQEVGETTRPANRERLTAFEDQFLVPLQNAIAARDKAAFESAYGAAVVGCNTCHASTGHPYVAVQIPVSRPADYVQP
ncbi:MAG TPA: hypothetical protein VGM03_13950 [Phycisphaerae bacterium]